jgi:hypothetical protein
VNRARAATAPRPEPPPVRINLAMPVTRIGFGPFSFDPLEQMIGAKLADLLEPLMVGPVTRRPSEAGPALEVYPLALPPGEGASIPLGQWGDLGFRNDAGLLVLTVPFGMAGWLRQKLGDAIVRGPEAGLSVDGTARVAEAWVRLRPGMRASVPLGVLGEAAVEAA